MLARPSTPHDLPASGHPDASLDPDEGDLVLRVSGHLPTADFQPFAVGLARRLKLRGWIRAESGAAVLRLLGDEANLVRFVHALRHDRPGSVSIRAIDTECVAAATPPVGERFVALVIDPVPLASRVPEPPLANVA